MHKLNDRVFLQPSVLFSASQVNVYDAINLVAYAKVPLPSVRRGRELIAGFIPRAEGDIAAVVLTQSQIDALVGRYESEIVALRYPVGPLQYAPLLERMVEADEAAMPYFFHEHHELVHARRRAALVLKLQGKLADLVRTEKLTLQLTESERATWVSSGAWMSQETLSTFLDSEGVSPWWKNRQNLESHSRLVRIFISDGVKLPHRDGPEPIDQQQLPSYVYAQTLLQRTKLPRGSSELPRAECEDPLPDGKVLRTESAQTGNSGQSPRVNLKSSKKDDMGASELAGEERASTHSSGDAEAAGSVPSLSAQTSETRGVNGAARDSGTELTDERGPVNDGEMLSKKAVADLIGVSTGTVDNYRTRPDFPKPHCYSPTTIRWNRAEILQWKDLNRTKK